ncbi:TPA: hypothetical protein ROY01_006026 [Bacillus toyonensis]|nr:hypothetical protein [Bacillus toyonensis]
MMLNLSKCNKLQNFSEPTSFPEGHYIKLTFDIKDEHGNLIEIFKDELVPNEDTECSLLITEVYHHSIFSREYGAGKTLNTFTLLPGEKTEIFISSRKRATAETSCILDSFNETSEDEYNEIVKESERNQLKSEELTAISGSAKGRTNYDLNGGKASGSFNGSMQSSRESFDEKMRSSLASHVSSQSSKRTIEVTASVEKVEEENTESVKRTIENYNKNRTLNFVFRQLNQRFVSIRHLVDVRISVEQKWMDSSGVNYKILGEYPLSKLKDVLDIYIKDISYIKEEVKTRLLAQLNFMDYKGEPYTLYEEVEFDGNEGEDVGNYVRFKRCFSVYDENELCKCISTSNKSEDCQKDISSKAECIEPIKVPGYILSVEAYMMKTNGVVVDALLGKNNAYEDYLLDLRKEGYKKMQLDNAMMQTMIDREKLAQDIVKNPDNSHNHCDEATTRYQKVFCCDPLIYDCNNKEHQTDV